MAATHRLAVTSVLGWSVTQQRAILTSSRSVEVPTSSITHDAQSCIQPGPASHLQG